MHECARKEKEYLGTCIREKGFFRRCVGGGGCETLVVARHSGEEDRRGLCCFHRVNASLIVCFLWLFKSSSV
jgi:hypothetical protein